MWSSALYSAGDRARRPYDGDVDPWAWWLIALAALVLIEAVRQDLVFATFGGAALLPALIAGRTGAGFGLQVLAFAAMALLTLPLRPVLLNRYRAGIG
jgi:membrane protein implicated in regulation of membrane protease activity